MRWGRHTNTLLESLPMMPGYSSGILYELELSFNLWLKYCKPKPNESIYDRLRFRGNVVKCLDYLRNKGEEWQECARCFGQEVIGLTSSIARMNLYLNGVRIFQ